MITWLLESFSAGALVPGAAVGHRLLTGSCRVDRLADPTPLPGRELSEFPASEADIKALAWSREVRIMRDMSRKTGQAPNEAEVQRLAGIAEQLYGGPA